MLACLRLACDKQGFASLAGNNGSERDTLIGAVMAISYMRWQSHERFEQQAKPHKQAHMENAMQETPLLLQAIRWCTCKGI